MIGFQGVNCNSYVQETRKSNAYNFLITLCNFRILNMKNEKARKLLKNAITNPNLSKEHIKKEILENNLKEYDLINQINDRLYDDKNMEETLKSIKRVCNKVNPNNKQKIDYIRRKNIIENLENSNIRELMNNEQKINIVLDNARIHVAKMVKKAAKILNINLIFLPPYCPDLNPIEDIWRVIKKTTYKTLYNSAKELIKTFKDTFYEIIHLKSFYEMWLKKFGINF